MRMKIADDKSKRIALLEDLKQSPWLDSYQKDWLYDELIRLKKGIQGERDAAFYLDNYLKEATNHVVLHDLRLVVDDEVAQIDHLIINRLHRIFLLETKNYACNLVISDHGEFIADYGSKRFGIPSPIEQSIRHERVLCKVLERLGIAGRTQHLPVFHHVVMLDPKAIVTRPADKAFDTRNVIKADQFPSWHQHFNDQISVGSVVSSLLNMRSLNTIKEWGEKLMREHRPAELLTLPDFMKPREHLRVAAPVHRLSPVVSAPQVVPVDISAVIGSPVTEPVKRLVCAHCSAKITFPEGKYCWNNAHRFGGLAYCREHQSLFKSP